MVKLFKNYLFKNFNSILKANDPPMDVDSREILYISDLDGTLLDTEGTLPRESIVRLNALIDDGLNFTIATARNYDSVHPLLQGLNLKLPVILFNGVYLTEFHSGRIILLSDFISKEIIHEMVAMACSRGVDPFIYTYGENHRVYYRKADNPGVQAYLNSLENDDRLCRVEEYSLSEGEQVSGFLLIDKRKNLEPVYKGLKQKYPEGLSIYFAEDIAMKGYYWLQSFHQEASKGRMVKLLAEHLHFPLNRVVVFGDYLNDLDMFQVAGRAIAVDNALPEIKNAANEIIGSNDSGAVINYLESVWSRQENSKSL